MKILALTLILFLLAVAASAQRRTNDPALNRSRENNLVISVEQFRLRNERLRLGIARNRLLHDRQLAFEKRRFKRTTDFYKRKHSVKRRHKSF